MINPLATAPLAPHNVTRTEHYTDGSKQALHSATDANAENIVKQGKTQQSEINNAQLAHDTVEISDEARAMLQKTVNEPQKSTENQHNSGQGNQDKDNLSQENLKQEAPHEQSDKKVQEAEERIKSGPSQETDKQSESKDTIAKLREMLKEAEKELQKAMEQLRAAQAQAQSQGHSQAQGQAQGQSQTQGATSGQGQTAQSAEVEVAQQQVLSAQQKVQVLQSQILEAEKGMV